ncbi:hypothetical protein GCM10028868_25610 [Virgibacillus kimchii]
MKEVKYFKNHDFHVTKGKLKTVDNGEGIIFEDGTRVKGDDVINVEVV